MKKNKYFKFKDTLIDPKDFEHKRINLYIEPRAYKKVWDMLHKIEDKLIDKKKIKQGKKSPIIRSESFEGKWKIAGPINTVQTHNLIVGGLVSKDYENSWKKKFKSMSNIELINIKINNKVDICAYNRDEYNYAMKLLKERRS
tara:strand:- start:308 stop:736 length:429 start_codon:yes stop_codon:yes gene_type:complete